MKVLIVGADSYIGKSLKEYLKGTKDIEVDMVHASNDEWKSKDFNGYDSILHLAGLVHKKESKYSDNIYYKINRDLVIDVASKAKESGVKQFIFMSTAAVFGSNVTCIDKSTVPNPTTVYGKSKLQGEEEVLKLQNKKFSIVIVRPPMVYGYNCKGNFQRLVKLVQVLPIFPSINNRRSMIYIDNLCEFLKLIILKQLEGYYHPQNDEYVSTKELVELISMNLNCKIRFIRVFNFLISRLKGNIGSLNKVFGDLYYTKDLSSSLDADLSHYCLVDFEDSVRKSIY